MFSMLASRLGAFEDLRVADLYAGTGALGLEALSRGAAHATFVERDRAAVTALNANIAKLGAGAATMVLTMPVEAVGRAFEPFDLLLLDPPYGEGLALPALSRLVEYGWVAPHALVPRAMPLRSALVMSVRCFVILNAPSAKPFRW